MDINVGMGNFNPIQNFNQELQKDLSQFKIDDNKNPLEGHIQVGIPSPDSVLNDTELANDLKTLVGHDATVNSLDSPDRLFQSFAHALEDGINKVSNDGHNAERAVETFAAGGNIDVHDVMIASQKSQLSLQLAMQLRNKFVQAYQEISKLQV